MRYTQVELSCDNKCTVWWLPVSEKEIKVGEKITREANCNNLIQHVHDVLTDWVVSQVCITLDEKDIPVGARISTEFQRETQTINYTRMK